MTTEPTRPDSEDVAILQALRSLDAVDPESLREILRTEDPTDDVLLRRYTEVLGLLAWGAEPRVASAALKGRVLTALAGDETQQIDPGSIRPPRPPRGTAPSQVAEARTSRRARPAARWLAAGLAILALGLAGGLVWLSGQVEAQKERLAAQERTLEQLDAALEEARAEQASVADAGRNVLEEVRERFRLVTAPDTEICPMLPPDSSPHPGARGVLYVAADHQHWYLKAEGLEPAEGPRVYRLWFVVGPDDEPVDAGTFRVDPSGEIQLGSPTMPEGTKAALITLEPPDAGDRPAGPVVLYGDEVMRIL